MLRNTYILHINDPRSLQYRDECIRSCEQFPNINPIPVTGLNAATAESILDEYGIKTIPYYTAQLERGVDTINKAFSCTMGHYKIWQKIVESGESGVVLEHDAIVKADYTLLQPVDGEILWLGPRIELEHDYNYPTGVEEVYYEVDRYEGTHAYAITPNTAQQLIENLKLYGFHDSIDGQLGMRNMFDMKFRVMDPPFVVAVLGNRSSCIEQTGNPGFWNAYNTPLFLENTRAGANILPERKLLFSNTSFLKQTDVLQRILDASGKTVGALQKVLVIGGYEGLSSSWLADRLCQNDDSMLWCVSSFRGTTEQKAGLWPTQQLEEICKYNIYFSKYYYKVTVIPDDKDSMLLAEAVNDPEISFDVIYVDGNHEYRNVLFDGINSWNLLNNGGILIFDDCHDKEVRLAVNTIIKTVNPIIKYDGDIVVLKKGIE
jgi:hypothetical protein